MATPRRSALAVLCGLATLAGACGTPTGPVPPQPVRLDWHEVTLPVPPGPAGRLAVRAAAGCAGRWYLAGAVVDDGNTTDTNTRPAAWVSADDAATWQPLKTAPISYYGERAVLYSAACREGVMGAIGAKRGGAHGNPRVNTWYLDGDTMRETVAAFSTYGGPDAVSVDRLTAGPNGWLISGNRITGGAVWLSADAKEFRIVENSPNLASDPTVDTAARDATAFAGGWTVVGGGTTVGQIARSPLVWTSSDGDHWTRHRLPGADGYTDVQRVVPLGDELVAVGLRGGTFGAWRGKDDQWQAVGRFGATGKDHPPSVRSVTVSGRTVFATVTDGVTYGMWASTDRGEVWQTVALPAPQAAGDEHNVDIVAAGDTLLLLGDDARQGRVWVAHLSS
jgi:hypothetical protein